MRITKQARREAKQLFRSCLTDGVLDEGRTQEAVKRVIQARPRGYLAILSQFERLVRQAIAERTARVESAVPLGPDMQAGIQASLNRVYGPGLHLSFAQNPALIGGMRIKVGSDVFDGSVQGRLEALQESF